MTWQGEPAYLVTNFREALSILESLRASSAPGRGMRHLLKRPVVEALRASEAETVTGGVAGEFPVLCRVDRSVATEINEVQRRCVPLSQIQAFVFRTAADRDQFAGKMFENVSSEGRRTEVAPELFGRPGPPRFEAGRRTNEVGPDPSWVRADALAGAAGAVLALSGQRPEIAQRARAFFLGEPGPPVTLAALAAAVDARGGALVDAGACAGAVAFGLRSAPGQDPLEMLELFVAALGTAGYTPDIVGRFREYVADIITDRRPRRSQDLADSGDLLLRSLLLFMQRDRIDEILDDTADGVPPGPSVHLGAAALGGFREGLARMPSALKARFQDALGDFASAIETDPAAPLEGLAARLAALLPTQPVPPPPSRSIADLVRTLQASASALGLMSPRPDDGIIGSCSEPSLVARIVRLPADDDGSQRLALLVSVGEVEGAPLLREALKGAVHARRGSFLWRPDGAGPIELAFPFDPDKTGDLAAALAHNLELVRQWLASGEAAQRAKGAASGKRRRTPATRAGKAAARAEGGASRSKRSVAGDAGAPAAAEPEATGEADLAPAIAGPPVPPAKKKRAPGKRATGPKAAAAVQEDLLAPPAAGPRSTGEEPDPAAGNPSPDPRDDPTTAGPSEAGGSRR